jgi:hypothetical protein
LSWLPILNIGALGVVPLGAAWGFGQIWKKTWPEFLSFGHVTNPRWRRNADSGKRLGQNFFKPALTSDWLSWLPWHDYRDKLENRWKHLFEIFKIGAS